MFFESVLAYLNPDIEQIKTNLKNDQNLLSKAIIETNYILNHGFLPLNFILKNIKKIENIPTKIIHGRYDAICSAFDAWNLHKNLKNSTLKFPIAGHSAFDPNLKIILQKTVLEFVL